MIVEGNGLRIYFDNHQSLFDNHQSVFSVRFRVRPPRDAASGRVLQLFSNKPLKSCTIPTGEKGLESLYHIYLYEWVKFLATGTDRRLVGERVATIER